MSIFYAAILGVVQGLTEFLPVSSSGHLVLAEHLLNLPMSDDITFEVFVHFGTLLSVVVALWSEVKGIFRSLWEAVVHFKMTPAYYRESEYFRTAVLIVVASIPAAIIGIRYEDAVGEAFTDPKLVAVMLIVTGLILFMTQLAKPAERKGAGLLSAFVIGLAQAVAIIPGISRSGSTISTAMFLRIPPTTAARFSFLLSVPVIFGATLLKTVDVVRQGVSFEALLPLFVGTIVAFGSGYFAIRFLLRIIEKGNFSVFSFYCLIVGTLGIIFL